jgi:hypothetical protein
MAGQYSPKLGQEGQAVGIGQAQVQNRKVEALPGQRLQRRSAVADALDFVPKATDLIHHQAVQGRIVLDDQNAA